MITLTRVKEATSDFIKILRFGKNDIQTSEPILPHGVDSKPVKEKIAVHSTTANIEETVILGYILHSEKTKEGETRIYATDEGGVEVFDIFLKRDGTCEFGGNTDFFVRYNQLNSGLQTFVTALDVNLAAAFLSVGVTWVPVILNIGGAKIDNIKAP